MFRLTREVRFALNQSPDDQLNHPPTNSYGGYPSLNGMGAFLRLQVTLHGDLDPSSSYLRNIKEIDHVVRHRIVAGVDPSMSVTRIFQKLAEAFSGHALDCVTLFYSPSLSTTQLASELGMHTRLSQKFEFSASHRLHNPKLTDEENRRIYGKCNNSHGHGHNYEVQVTLRGKPDTNGLVVDVPEFEMLVKQVVIDRMDHRHLNLEVSEFAELIPTVENIAMVVYRLLKSRFEAIDAELAGVTVWETPKTWCEYSE